jgi:hypothetical protein
MVMPPLPAPSAITTPVDLCDARGCRPGAAGWSPPPAPANLKGPWAAQALEYWCVTTPEFYVSLITRTSTTSASPALDCRPADGP